MLLRLLRYMKLQRAVEDRIVALYRQGKIVGGVYTGRGHEAIGVGSAVHLRSDDVVYPSHRDLGAYLLKGMSPATVLAQYLGREGGPTRGRDGNLHMGDLGLGIGSFISHMADTVPVSAGAALSFKLRGQPNVVLCFTGDGATSRGDWHEGLNLAAVMALPIVYVCVNNQYAYSTPLNRQMAVETVAERATGYGMPVATVDGNDVLAVYQAAGEALDRARGGGGPSFIEARTWRMTGHSMADDASYVRDGFFEEGERLDPVARYVAWLQATGVLDEKALGELDGEIAREVEEGREQAEASPFPRPETAATGVYATPVSREAPEGPAAEADTVEPVTYLEAIRSGLREELQRDPNVFLIGEDIGIYGGAFKATQGLIEEFGPERVIDTPLSEAGFTGAAIGAALMGMRPVVEYQFADFISCAFDQITNFAARTHYRLADIVPVVFRAPVGGGIHGGPFHSQHVEMYFAHTPGLKIVAPATARDAKGLLKAAIRDDDPVLFLEHKYLYRRVKERLPPGDWTVPIGRAAVRAEGDGVTVLTYGSMVHTCLEALAQVPAGAVQLVDLRTLVPLDMDTILDSVRKTGKVVVAHQDHRTGGFGGELMARIAEHAFEWLDAPLRRVAAPDSPVPFSPPLEEAYLPGVDDVVRAVEELLAY